MSTRFAGFWLVTLALFLLPVAPIYSQDNGVSIDLIVSSDSSVQSVSAKQVRKLFLGKNLKLPDGSSAVPVLFRPLSKAFNKFTLRRSDAQVQAKWSRLKFSGRSLEPESFESVQALIRFVTENSNAIAYIPSAELTSDVRSVLKLTY